MPALVVAQTDEQSWLFGSWTPIAEHGRESAGALVAASALQPSHSMPALAQAGNDSDDCRIPGMPEVMETVEAIEFIHAQDRIRIRFNEWNVERTIYLQPGSGPPVQDPSPLGVSFGRWENSTLAIFTLYISNPSSDGNAAAVNSALTTLERYKPQTSGEQLTWELTISDSTHSDQPKSRQGAMGKPGFSQPIALELGEGRFADCSAGRSTAE